MEKSKQQIEFLLGNDHCNNVKLGEAILIAKYLAPMCDVMDYAYLEDLLLDFDIMNQFESVQEYANEILMLLEYKNIKININEEEIKEKRKQSYRYRFYKVTLEEIEIFKKIIYKQILEKILNECEKGVCVVIEIPIDTIHNMYCKFEEKEKCVTRFINAVCACLKYYGFYDFYFYVELDEKILTLIFGEDT